MKPGDDRRHDPYSRHLPAGLVITPVPGGEDPIRFSGTTPKSVASPRLHPPTAARDPRRGRAVRQLAACRERTVPRGRNRRLLTEVPFGSAIPTPPGTSISAQIAANQSGVDEVGDRPLLGRDGGASMRHVQDNAEKPSAGSSTGSTTAPTATAWIRARRSPRIAFTPCPARPSTSPEPLAQLDTNFRTAPTRW